MPSIVHNHYPQIVWRDGKKQLWNPIQRKALKNLPEERVRLRVIEYLVDGGWSKHRISAEEALTSSKKKRPLRTDLICYTQNFDPYLLVECKAGQVKINEGTATQIARYNQNIGAPYLLMTNGLQDFWYRIGDNQSVQRLETPPEALPEPHPTKEQPLSYWKQRGFAGDKASPALRKWIKKALNDTVLNPDYPSRFLSFKTNPTDTDLNGYYVVHPLAEHRIAITLTATAYGGSRLVCILNREGTNAGVMEVDLDLLFDEREPNATLYTADGTQNIDIRTAMGDNRLASGGKALAGQLHDAWKSITD